MNVIDLFPPVSDNFLFSIKIIKIKFSEISKERTFNPVSNFKPDVTAKFCARCDSRETLEFAELLFSRNSRVIRFRSQRLVREALKLATLIEGLDAIIIDCWGGFVRGFLSAKKQKHSKKKIIF